MLPTLCSVALVTSSLLASAALGQPAPPPTEVGAPAEPGDHQPATTIASDVAGWSSGSWGAGVGVSRAVARHVALHADAALVYAPSDHTRGYQFGASVPIYFRRAFSGLFLEPGVSVRRVKPDCSDCMAAAGPVYHSDVDVGLATLVGWQWTLRSGLSVAAALGVA